MNKNNQTLYNIVDCASICDPKTHHIRFRYSIKIAGQSRVTLEMAVIGIDEPDLNQHIAVYGACIADTKIRVLLEATRPSDCIFYICPNKVQPELRLLPVENKEN